LEPSTGGLPKLRHREPVFDISDCIGWRCPRWYSWARVPLYVQQQACDHAHSYNHGRPTYPRIPIDILVSPPEQHSIANTEPDAGPNELELEQAEDHLKPCPNREHESEPVEQNHSYKEYRNGHHFPSPTLRVAPAMPGEGAAVRRAGPGQGCAREQHRQRSDTG
jgi:hypothetical protein